MVTFIGRRMGETSNGSIDFSLRVETEEWLFGPQVEVVMRKFNGDVLSEWMSAFEAVDFVLRHPDLGESICSAHIAWHGVYDEWGQSM